MDDASASAHDRAEDRNADRRLQTTVKDARQSASFTTAETLLLTRVVKQRLRQKHRSGAPTPAAIQDAQASASRRVRSEARRERRITRTADTRACEGVDDASASAATEQALRTR